MATTITLKASGLNTSPNQLGLQDGALSVANNVIIKDENVIEPRRGQKLFGEALPVSSNRAKQLFEYRDRIFRHYASTLDFQNGLSNSGETVFSAFSQPLSEVQEYLRIKKVESNGNLYLTSFDGVKKISSATGAGLSSASITDAGGIKAVDLTATLNVEYGDQTSFLPQDSTVAYRIVWGYNDANKNLILGTPSQREEVYNPLITLLNQDFNVILRGLDGVSQMTPASVINDGNYVSSLLLPSTATPVELKTNAIALAEKIDKDILLAGTGGIFSITSATITGGICTVTLSGGVVSDYIIPGGRAFLTGFTPVSGTLDGNQLIATSTATTFTFLTTATGAVTLSSAKIESGDFRQITQPSDPSIPASNDQLVEIQTYLDSIIVLLQNAIETAPTPIITLAAKTVWINPLTLTKNAKVTLKITIPDGVTSDYFYQVYRSSIVQATGATALDDLVPSDELQLVYEDYPTSAQLTAKEVIVIDLTPDEFRGANLYTNPSTGEGILNSNDLPPFCKDLNRYKNVVFYANTRTRNKLNLSLLGVEKIIEDFDNSLNPKITILQGSDSFTLTFIKGVREETSIVCNAATTLNNSGVASYFLINLLPNEYYIWYARGTATDPALSGKIGIRVDVDSDADTLVASKTSEAISTYSTYFLSTFVGNTITLTNLEYGSITDNSSGTSGFTVTTLIQGVGENASLGQVLLSDQASIALAVDETARSIVRVINQNINHNVNAYYLSSSSDVPGKIYLEAKTLENSPFYVLGNTVNIGISFNPNISNDFNLTSITLGSSPVITTNINHNLVNGDNVTIVQTNSTPSIDGTYSVFDVTPTTFKINLSSPVTVVGTSGIGIESVNAVFSDNEVKPNRIYYSKLSQPEAVPILNYLDVGDSDKEILRIFPLRDSLFVFKEEGLYRISGETAPFTLALFDSSCQLIAPDTVDVSNNYIYGFTTQGISTITEGGVAVISTSIDNDLLKIRNFPISKKIPFGVGYESDNSYTIYLGTRSDSTYPNIGYRFGTGSGAWTTSSLASTCGFVNKVDDKLYLGATDVPYISQERKDFERTDYSDREYSSTISDLSVFPGYIRFSNITNLRVGDVITQTQLLTCYEYNMLLKKLDSDSGVSFTNYYSTLKAVAGDNLRTKLIQLATKLDLDPGVSDSNYLSSINTYNGTITSISVSTFPVITTAAPHNLVSGRNVLLSGTNCTPSLDGTWEVTVTSPTTFTINKETTLSGTSGSFNTDAESFQDIRGCYNEIILKLNNDVGVSYSSYTPNTTETIQEVIITAIDKIGKRISVNLDLEFTSGPVTIYEYIETITRYTPNTIGDTVSYKHLREASITFENKRFTNAYMAFATDLLPELIEVKFNGDGNGIFGHNNFGEGFFGGVSHGAPHRTYIPRQCQRCIYMTVQFRHAVARESYRIFALSLTGENTQSSRAYRK